MNNNFDILFPYSNLNNIFSEKDIYIDHSMLNMDKNLEIEEANIKNTFEPFDNIFNNRNSMVQNNENEFQKISLIPYVQTPKTKNIFNNSPKDINLKENLNKKRKIKKIESNKYIKENNNQKYNKVIFNSFKINPISEEEKIEQKNRNKISARKSRLKKKQYITKLEQEHSLLMSQIEEIRQNLCLNKNIIPSIEIKDNSINEKVNNCDYCLKIENLKLEENLILKNENASDKNTTNLLGLYSEKQKKVLEKMLINQILIMMPIKIKIFQDKYLKLFNFNSEESLNDIKIKIEKNLQTIQELYDISNLIEKENGLSNEKNNKNDSMAKQIYNYYYNLKKYVNDFEKITLL